MLKEKVMIRTISIVAMIAAVFGCTTSPVNIPDPIEGNTVHAQIAATPDAVPSRTWTSFTESLHCVDSMLSKYDVPNVSVGVVDIKSHTSEVSGICLLYTSPSPRD